MAGPEWEMLVRMGFSAQKADYLVEKYSGYFSVWRSRKTEFERAKNRAAHYRGIAVVSHKDHGWAGLRRYEKYQAVCQVNMDKEWAKIAQLLKEEK